jgi:hypothetical protein
VETIILQVEKTMSGLPVYELVALKQNALFHSFHPSINRKALFIPVHLLCFIFGPDQTSFDIQPQKLLVFFPRNFSSRKA